MTTMAANHCPVLFIRVSTNCSRKVGSERKIGGALWTAPWIVRWVVLAFLVVIVASYPDIVLERILPAIYHGSHICEDRLDLRLLRLIQTWRAQVFQSCRIVPVDTGRHSCCAEITNRVSVATVTR
jgi:hypothetical protein